jgi:hypothetical protein
VVHLGLIYETYEAFRELSSYVQIVLLSSLHNSDSPTIEQGT